MLIASKKVVLNFFCGWGAPTAVLNVTSHSLHNHHNNVDIRDPSLDLKSLSESLDVRYKLFCQVYLVAGGNSEWWGANGGGSIFDSTELLTEGASAWVFSGVLPTPTRHFSAATLDNKLFATGRSIWY